VETAIIAEDSQLSTALALPCSIPAEPAIGESDEPRQGQENTAARQLT
jgi:hypothetical protein